MIYEKSENLICFNLQGMQTNESGMHGTHKLNYQFVVRIPKSCHDNSALNCAVLTYTHQGRWRIFYTYPSIFICTNIYFWSRFYPWGSPLPCFEDYVKLSVWVVIIDTRHRSFLIVRNITDNSKQSPLLQLKKNDQNRQPVASCETL